jgi:hypothetical protein
MNRIPLIFIRLLNHYLKKVIQKRNDGQIHMHNVTKKYFILLKELIFQVMKFIPTLNLFDTNFIIFMFIKNLSEMYFRFTFIPTVLMVILMAACSRQVPKEIPGPVQDVINGPLRIHKDNPRYFTDNSGKAIYLTGSHTWQNLMDFVAEEDSVFDYEGYLGMMQDNGHNFMRMWTWSQTQMGAWTADTIFASPNPFLRTGPGLALDGKPKFDLTKYNPEYFDRLRRRVEEAGKRGIYVSVMLFNGWSIDRIASKTGNPFPFQPYNIANNINNIGAPETPGDYDDRPSLHSIMIAPELLTIQENYVRHVIETVNDLDNVLYEIINEGGSIAWQYHMIRFIKKTEAGLPKQHPVGMTHTGENKTPNQVLFDSPADWISPNHVPIEWECGDSVISTSYKTDPPDIKGRKVVFNDTDHLWGHGGNHIWVWKSFMRGINVLFMDPWYPMAGKEDEVKAAGWIYLKGGITKDDRNYHDFDLVRKNMGYTRRFASRLDLGHTVPHPELSSTRYCLADPGNEYLMYFPEGGEAGIDLRDVSGIYSVEWFIPLTNRTVIGPKQVSGGEYLRIEPPTILDAVLYLKRI